MARPSLKRLLRGAARRAVEDLAALAGAPLAVLDEHGALVLGSAAAEGERFPVVADGVELGAVRGPAAAASLAVLIAHLAEREAEKVALAEETLGRYKELTLLYDISEKLSGILDVDEVCRIVVNEARSFLQAASAAVFMVDHRRGLLQPMASTGDTSRVRPLATTAGVEGRVLQTRRAEFVEDASTTEVGASESGVAALMVAPLRSGDTVFGLLRVSSTERAAWNSGHLKFVTSLAGHAASAISHAMLHRERLRQQALRHQIERFASPAVLAAALADAAPDTDHSLAVVFCDAGELAHHAGAELPPDEVMALVRRATTSTLAALMQEGGAAQVSHEEIVVGVFAGAEPGPPASAAVRAATRAARALDRRFGGFVARSPGIGIAHTALPPQGDTAPAFLAAVGAAAALQAQAEGRILIDAGIAGAAGVAPEALLPASALAGTAGGAAAPGQVPAHFEVRA